MSRRRRVRCLWAAVVLALLAMAGAVGTVRAAGPAVAVVAGPAVQGPAAVTPAAVSPAAVSSDQGSAGHRVRGPACAPGSSGHGPGDPAVPPRAGQEHASVLAARPAPEQARPHLALRVRVPVRGPDRPAPGPVELSVLRV
ncbi:hypothetical protein [Streptomyces sp. NBC_00091]|uniref:hypothetical protein n=1 Tax=Streptomyces sp. NBC_00091 TaxID=2975648 RepID=UPI00224CB0D9|nr:hypothetical protein [Streptomyces sp. NBC_00091]MCX5377015.1 hypothetical protein [Streptomyces sp. NBC_00091]